MTVLRDVHLHGVLAEKYGDHHRFALNTPRDAIAALSANFDGFRRDFHQFPHYGIICDGDNRHPGNCPDVASYPFSRDIHLMPMVEGRFGLFVPLLGLVGIVGTPATLISGVLTIGLMFGLSLLFAPKPPDTDQSKDENYLFTGPENTTEQGGAVPLIYGRCFVGSVVISAGTEVAQGVGSEQAEGQNYTWTSTGGTMAEASDSTSAANDLHARRLRSAPEPEGRRTLWRLTNE